MLKVSVSTKKVNSEDELTVTADVSKDTINFFSELTGRNGIKHVEGETGNDSDSIRGILREYSDLAVQHGRKRLLVICEPTGDYHRKLMKLARKAGHKTAFVSGQAVNKMEVVESNDTGKSDHKDPKVINTLSKLDKIFEDRDLGEDYQRLRLLNEMYEEEDKSAVARRNQVHHVFNLLFPDWSLKMDFVYTRFGEVIWSVYRFNPIKIVSGGRAKFLALAKKHSPRTMRKTLDKIWKCAKSSRSTVPEEESARELLERRLGQLLEQRRTNEDNKKDFRKEMLGIYAGLDEAQKFKDFDILDDFTLARLIAETGPLKDFSSYRKLYRYVGLNLRERESGKYAGKLKITKRGRSLFRKVIFLAARRLAGQKGGMFYARHQAKKNDLANGMKALVNLMRFLTKCVWGVYRSDSKFDLARVFNCEGARKEAA